MGPDFLCPLSANKHQIEFLEFTISDYVTKNIIFMVSSRGNTYFLTLKIMDSMAQHERCNLFAFVGSQRAILLSTLAGAPVY